MIKQTLRRLKQSYLYETIILEIQLPDVRFFPVEINGSEYQLIKIVKKYILLINKTTGKRNRIFTNSEDKGMRMTFRFNRNLDLLP